MQAELLDAVRKLESLCTSTEDLQERKMHLSVLVEQFRLLGLYSRTAQMENGQEKAEPEGEELDAVRHHLEPLGLAPPGTPLVELARLAALKIAMGVGSRG